LEIPTGSDSSIVIARDPGLNWTGLDVTIIDNGSHSRLTNTIQGPADSAWPLQISRRTQVASFVLSKILVPRRTSRGQPHCQRQQLVATGSDDGFTKSQITPFSRRLDKMGRSRSDGLFHGLWSWTVARIMRIRVSFRCR
jgi:hypothetical protein